MKCPFCAHQGDKVVDSRESKDGELIRRRRECLSCGRRFTSYERIEEIQFMVIKKDGRRQLFDRTKLLNGILASCQKRPVSMAQCQETVNDVLSVLYQKPDREISTTEIGEIVMKRLKELDQVAYVRFASVYREFQDVSEFMGEVKPLIEGEDEGNG
ncbi:transcriptional regulator NrdR [Sulfidibacter corallicola]|uniref:Transcriptional repressor NrdR n=1 Tax=Sulfidibacter corallicola TaxID=2818388 RepID=A0A8A4TWM1_SULCO|nr:transcriptional regulator NrdR [Sulfidibacter corallicola]QTD53524.1 transcriptional repressor NrdR [Sulfidibacter corallicola]